ncbi:LacI family DNA-binding transcriptional regulator [Enterobacteriaceae bacterium ESL0689]|nr:LacI family DNA-binding transcriptional regulator [Enterobacteriaceae bacterium ESL0689]
MMKKIKFSDIAEMAGVSTTTVSHIFNGNAERQRISAITKKKILAIASHFADQPHIQRAIIKATRNKTLGVIVPDISNFSFALFLHKLESLARDYDMLLIISCSHYDKHQEMIAINNLLEHHVDGMIAITSLDIPDIYEKINKTTPVLLYDRFITGSELPFVTSESIYSVSQLIASKAQYFTEFWFLAGDVELSTISERLAGFKQGLKQAGLQLKSQWISCDNYRENLGYFLLDNIVKNIGRVPQAIFTPSGNLLEGVLLYLKDKRIAHHEVYLCSYDYHLYHDFLNYDVDILAQDYDLLAKHCLENIQRLINKQELSDRNLKIKPKLITANKRCSH